MYTKEAMEIGKPLAKWEQEWRLQVEGGDVPRVKTNNRTHEKG